MNHSTDNHTESAASSCCASSREKNGPTAGSASAHAHHQPHDTSSHAHHAHGGHGGSPASLATAATLHCLTGCVIGEVIGLAIGVTLGFDPWATIVLATALSYVSGFALGLRPLIRQGMGFMQALRAIWLGEAISIGVMEIAMNFADYHMGGMATNSVFDSMFWRGVAVAVPAGFIAAWPVNWWLLKRSIKQPCH